MTTYAWIFAVFLLALVAGGIYLSGVSNDD